MIPDHSRVPEKKANLDTLHMYTIIELSRICGVYRKEVVEWYNAGLLKGYEVNGKIYIYPEDAELFMNTYISGYVAPLLMRLKKFTEELVKFDARKYDIELSSANHKAHKERTKQRQKEYELRHGEAYREEHRRKARLYYQRKQESKENPDATTADATTDRNIAGSE